LGVENGRRGLEAWTRSRSTLVEMGGKVATVFGPLE
jgi:betaine-aldehyde dehydrogenase